MESKQEIKLKMYITVRDYLAKFLTILNVLPGFTTFYQLLTSLILQIQSSGEVQQTDNSGNTTSKGKVKRLVARLAADTARKLNAYARFLKDEGLKKQTDTAESNLKRLSDTELINAAQVLHDLAQTHIANLESYRIDGDTQENLQTAIDKFNDSISIPRLSTAESTQTTKQLANLYEQADETLDELDAIVGILTLDQVDFYNGYKTVRKLVKTGVTKLALKALVKDAVTGKPLKSVKVYFTLQDPEGAPIGSNGKYTFMKKSSKKGGFNDRKAAEGTYTVMTEYPGYKKHNGTINIIQGQMTKLILELERA